MKIIICVVVCFRLVTEALVILNNDYKLVYGSDLASMKMIMTVAMAGSRIKCAILCQNVYGCGGFNVESVARGLFKCYFIQGITSLDDMTVANDTSFYQKSGEVNETVKNICVSYDLFFLLQNAKL